MIDEQLIYRCWCSQSLMLAWFSWRRTGVVTFLYNEALSHSLPDCSLDSWYSHAQWRWIDGGSCCLATRESLQSSCLGAFAVADDGYRSSALYPGCASAYPLQFLSSFKSQWLLLAFCLDQRSRWCHESLAVSGHVYVSPVKHLLQFHKEPYRSAVDCCRWSRRALIEWEGSIRHPRALQTG